ncbi:hormogonium polysaccharide secretion pseudopilin HpsB [Mastigocladopsis repens]|uniref:hormogonium polysaccharide secretion pseudopilin HpsB n=1 Tax=Mastigocladopsis repens TaxID=221287 RepID=UPI00036DDC0F|nr:hormogonium polysaccharide secretion pseudopilin HpsB [Mastigocladopsis repens]
MMIKHKQQVNPSSSESGFTIIESLVALLVVAILLTAIAPVILLSVATRVQAKRIEQATQATKTFIDGIRTGAISAPNDKITIELATKDKPRKLSNAPGDYLIDTTNMLPPKQADKDKLYCFNKNGNIQTPTCTSDLFFIQAKQITVNNNPKEGYRLGIRIYRKEAFDTSGDLIATSGGNKTTQATFIATLANSKAPLIEITTDISSNGTTFQSLCSRLGVASGDNCN